MNFPVINLGAQRVVLGQRRCEDIPPQYLSERYACELAEFKRKFQPPPSTYGVPPPPQTYPPAQPLPPQPPPVRPPTPTPRPQPPTRPPTPTGGREEVIVVSPRKPPPPLPPLPEPPLTFMMPQGGMAPPPPQRPLPPGEPPELPPVATPPSGTPLHESLYARVCFKCPDGSSKILSRFDARQQGCTEANPVECLPRVPTYDPRYGPGAPVASVYKYGDQPTVCFRCPDGSYSMKPYNQGKAQGCTEEMDMSKCQPPTPTTGGLTRAGLIRSGLRLGPSGGIVAPSLQGGIPLVRGLGTRVFTG